MIDRKTPKQIIGDMIEIEGGFVDNPNDLGGPTKYGITEATARRHGYNGPMKDLPMMTAKMILWKEYWIDSGCSRVNEVSSIIAEELFDIRVNQGGFHILWLQEILNAFTGSKLKVDGILGELTMGVLRAFLLIRRHQDGDQVLAKAPNVYQGMRYFNIVAANPSQREFIYGWIRHRV